MASKRSHCDAFGDLASLKESPNAKICGVLYRISPEMKTGGSCQHWDGEICDGREPSECMDLTVERGVGC